MTPKRVSRDVEPVGEGLGNIEALFDMEGHRIPNIVNNKAYGFEDEDFALSIPRPKPDPEKARKLYDMGMKQSKPWRGVEYEEEQGWGQNCHLLFCSYMFGSRPALKEYQKLREQCRNRYRELCGSGGLEASSADLKEALPQATILEGYGVRNARVAKAAEELDYFLKANGYVEGEVVELPDYSEQQPLTEEQSAIYHAATDDYMFPLGNPVSVGERQTANSHDYKYVVETQTPDGQTVNGVIYITVENGSEKTEFTRVVR